MTVTAKRRKASKSEQKQELLQRLFSANESRQISSMTVEKNSSIAGFLQAIAITIIGIMALVALVMSSLLLYHALNDDDDGDGSGGSGMPFGGTFDQEIFFNQNVSFFGAIKVFGAVEGGPDDDYGGNTFSSCEADFPVCDCIFGIETGDSFPLCYHGQRWCSTSPDQRTFGQDFACNFNLQDENGNTEFVPVWMGTTLHTLIAESSGACGFNATPTASSADCVPSFGGSVSILPGNTGVYMENDVLITDIYYADSGSADLYCNNANTDQAFSIDLYETPDPFTMKKFRTLVEGKVTSRMQQNGINIPVPGGTYYAFALRNNCKGGDLSNYRIKIRYRVTPFDYSGQL